MTDRLEGQPRSYSTLHKNLRKQMDSKTVDALWVSCEDRLNGQIWGQLGGHPGRAWDVLRSRLLAGLRVGRRYSW